jgi:hypothetical protein
LLHLNTHNLFNFFTKKKDNYINFNKEQELKCSKQVFIPAEEEY